MSLYLFPGRVKPAVKYMMNRRYNYENLYTARKIYLQVYRQAGNITTKEVKITDIDEYAPLILLSDLPPVGTYRKDALILKPL